MLKKLVNMAVMALAFLASASAALAGPEVERAQLNLTSSGRIVVSTGDDGNYSRIGTHNLNFQGNVDVKMKSGKLVGYKIFFGVCGPGQCGATSFKTLHSNGFSKRKDLKENVSFGLAADQIPQGLSPNVQASNLFRLCNKESRGQSGEVTVPHFLKLTLGLKFKQKGFDSSDIDWADERDIQVQVVCRARDPETSEVLAPPKPFSIDVKVEQKGETCPKQTDVTAIIKYRVPATARFRFKVDGKLSEIHEIKARKIEPDKTQPVPGGGGYYLVERLKTYHLDPGQTNFRIVMEDGSGKKSAVKTVKINCPPFEVTSAWLTYNVSDKPTCPKEVREKATFNVSRPGWVKYRIKHRGGLVVSEGKIKAKREGMKYVATARRTLMMNAFEGEFMAEVVDDTANSGWVPVRVDCLELNGDFSFLDSNGTRCPREGRALINFAMNIPATVHWSLDCNIGNFSGVAQPVSDNKGGYVAPALARFNVGKTTQVTCALKSVSPISRAHAIKWKPYQCITPSGVSGANDLKPETRPEPHAPRRPDKVVVTPPRQPGVNDRLDEIVVTGSKTEVACYGGTPKNGECHCARTHKAVPAGKNAFRCVQSVVVDPVKPDKRVDSTPDYPKKTQVDAVAEQRRLEALKKRQDALKKAREERLKAEAAKKRLEAAIAARKSAEAAKRQRQLELRKARMKAAQQARSVKVAPKRRKMRRRRAQ